MVPAERTWRQGLAIGLIAYASIALFYAVFDLLAARGTLFTVDMMGKAVFHGLRDPAVLQYPIRLDLAGIFWYNALHLVLSLVIGLTVAGLVDAGERRPARARFILLFLVAGYVVTVLAVGALSTAMRPVLPWWSIAAANGFATFTAGLYLLRRRPGLLRRLALAPG